MKFIEHIFIWHIRRGDVATNVEPFDILFLKQSTYKQNLMPWKIIEKPQRQFLVGRVITKVYRLRAHHHQYVAHDLHGIQFNVSTMAKAYTLQQVKGSRNRLNNSRSEVNEVPSATKITDRILFSDFFFFSFVSMFES